MAAALFALTCFAAAPLLAQAQTQIGGGSCNSGSLNGTYALTLSGRAVNATGVYTSVLQSNGVATFDGLSKITITANEYTNEANPAPINWSGTYSVQANCAATATITSGGTATLNLMSFAQGVNFALTGSDGTFEYTGSGNLQPTGCTAAMLSGVYAFSTTGFAVSGTTVAGAEDGAGLMQFDGQGNVTVNLTTTTGSAASVSVSMSGMYTITSGCTGTATLKDSNSNTYNLVLSAYSATKTYVSNFYTLLSMGSKFTLSGSAHAAYNLPTFTASNRLEAPPLPARLVCWRGDTPGTSDWGGRS